MTWIQRLFSRRRIERELSEEIRGHLEERIDDLVATGVPREVASAQASREFGNVPLFEQEARDVWRWHWIEDLLMDARFALRQLRQSPGFTAAAVLTVALGIGANTATFSVVNGVLLEPLPYPQADRLLQLNETTPTDRHLSVAYPNFADWRHQNRSFSELAAFTDESVNLTGSGHPEHLDGKLVSADFFRVLGAEPVLGRDFDPRTDRPGAGRVAIIGDGLWKRRFGSSPDVLGSSLVLNGQRYTIVGVGPAGFQFEGGTDVYTLIEQWNDAKARSREARMFAVVGRLKPGVTPAKAQSDLGAIAARLADAYPTSNAEHGVAMEPLRNVIVGNVRPVLLVLLGAVGFVLLIACANVANLLLARSSGRQQEIAVRSALGAGRGRVVRQLLTESLILALGGGMAGLAVARWGTSAVISAIPGGLPEMEQIGLDGHVLAFTLGVSLLAGLVFGLTPALDFAAADVHQMLTHGRRSAPAHRRLRTLLVISEVAAALVLLAGAGLMVRTMQNLAGVNPGFDPADVLTFSIGISPDNLSHRERILQSFQQILEKVRAVRGVRSAAISDVIPMSGVVDETPLYVNGRSRPASPAEMAWALNYLITPDYFKTMGIPLLRGRDITPQEAQRGAHVVLIDEIMARTVFLHEDPLGKSISFGLPEALLGPDLSAPQRIVGIVGHVNHWGLVNDATANVRSELYSPISETHGQTLKGVAAWATFVVRTDGNPLTAVPAVRHALRDLSDDQPVYAIRTMDQIVGRSLAGQRFSTLLLGLFAGLALLLAAVGIYGVISYTVARRTREIGIRAALGAGRTEIFKDVVVTGMVPVLLGLASGLVASIALTRLMAGMLYGISPGDPATLGGVVLALAAVSLVAMLIPAARATRVDPVVALQCE